MLLADWFALLAKGAGIQVTQYGESGDAFTIGPPSDFHVKARFVDTPPFLDFVASDPDRQNSIDAIIPPAVAKVDAGDLGAEVWYSTELTQAEFPKNSYAQFRSLRLPPGNETRITGWRRLGPDILLEFTEAQDREDGPHLTAPLVTVQVHIVAPGPLAGHFSYHVAHGVIETVVAICTFALGRPVALPLMTFPSEKALLTDLNSMRHNREVVTLTRNRVSLDIIGSLRSLEKLQLFRRAQAALITFDAAVQQQRDAVACVLYVVAAECLTVPDTKWRGEKLTKRFIEFFAQLVPDELDVIVAHRNFEDVFSMRRGTRAARSLRRDLLDHIYDFRSGQVHEGLNPSYIPLVTRSDWRNELRRSFFAEFVEAAILRYLTAPRSSLVGHPRFEQPDKDSPNPAPPSRQIFNGEMA